MNISEISAGRGLRKKHCFFVTDDSAVTNSCRSREPHGHVMKACFAKKKAAVGCSKQGF